MTKTLLSVDWDFFSREDPMWDFGHSEQNPVFAKVAWIARYNSGLDLYAETDHKFAGLAPDGVIDRLVANGMADVTGPVSLTVADSHAHAFDWWKDNRDGVEHIISLDAHHDVYNEDGEVDCANWLFHALRQNPNLRATIVYPRWREEFPEDFPENSSVSDQVTTVFVDEWTTEGDFDVTGVFVARSPAWTPPHHDDAFGQFVRGLWSHFGGEDITAPAGSLPSRWAPTREEAAALVAQSREAWGNGMAAFQESDPRNSAFAALQAVEAITNVANLSEENN